MTNQEAFDTVLAKLREQKVASSDGDSCMYQSDVGCCAVGHLLPSHLPLKGTRDNTVSVELLMKRVDEASNVLDSMDLKLLETLQSAHDLLLPLPAGVEESAAMAMSREGKYTAIGRSLANWEQEMQLIAALFNLNYEVPA